MKYKYKQACKSLISLLLVITFILTPFDKAFAASVNGETSTEPTGNAADIPPGGNFAPIHNLATTIAILEIDNTARAKYSAQIQAHNQGLSPDSDEYWSEYRVSVSDQYLYRHPNEMSDVAAMKKQALIVFDYRADTNVGNSSRFRPFANGTMQSKNYYSRVYGLKGKSAPGSFNPDIVYSTIKGNEVLYERFKSGQLTFEEVEQIGSGSVSGVVDDFVRLWVDSGTVDDKLNSMFDGLSGYDRALKYLDFLYTIDVLCGNTYDSLVSKYLEYLNRDESAKFITVCAAANAVMQMDTSNKRYIATLPNYYSAITGKTFSDYQTFSVTGNFVDAVTPESYGGGIDSFISTVKGRYEAGFRGVRYPSLYSINRNTWWWDSSGDRGAYMCQPTDINGNTTGNTGYTFLAIGNYEPTPDPGKVPNPGDLFGGGGGAGSPSSGNAPIQESAVAQFSITASSDQYEVMPGDTVAARIDINLKQPDSMLYDLKMRWTANGIKTGDWDPSFGIAITREGGGGDTAIDMLASNPSGSGGIDHSLDSSPTGGFTIMDVSWEEALELFNGRELATVYDEDVTINYDREQVYVAVVTLYWLGSTTETMQFYSKGKEIRSEYEGADRVPWIVREDEPNKGHFYSQLREGNYAEIKDSYPYSGETFEAMAGVPTTEDLYVGFGANEFMMNMECELKTDTGKQRIYKLMYTVPNCIGADNYCELSCSGHTLSCTCGGSATVDDCGAPPNGQTQISGTCSRCGSTLTATVMGVTAAGHKIKSGDTGCKITCHANTEHKHIHKYELTVTQNIDDYSYVDMTGTDLRQVVKLLYNGNKDLLSNPVRSVDPNTGYRAFVNQSEYSSGNGRIAFSWALSEDGRTLRYWGNTEENKSGDGDDTLFTEGEEAARTWYTGELSGMRVVANIISDYLTLGTTEGYKL